MFVIQQLLAPHVELKYLNIKKRNKQTKTHKETFPKVKKKVYLYKYKDKLKVDEPFCGYYE